MQNRLGWSSSYLRRNGAPARSRFLRVHSELDLYPTQTPGCVVLKGQSSCLLTNPADSIGLHVAQFFHTLPIGLHIEVVVLRLPEMPGARRRPEDGNAE